MRGELVSVDLETTGLDAAHDEIIEIGAVRLRDGQIVEEWSTLVNPGRPIPREISALTGIRPEDVLDAPGIHQVLPLLNGFVGNAPWIAHNIAFDAGFLRRRGALTRNPQIDTYELAAVLLPRAPRYNLRSLTAQLGIDIGTAHRALADARATALLYWALWQRALALPLETLEAIVTAGRGHLWDANLVFTAALNERRSRPSAAASIPEPEHNQRFDGTLVERPPSAATSERIIMPEEIDAVLGQNGALAQQFPGYTFRQQQIEMANAIASAFATSQHALIEAGTGTGKSLAYLVPAVLWAQKTGERVVISTNTINLQDQLIDQDIPLLQRAMPQPFSAAVMKGRANYLCPRRLTAVRQRPPASIEELRMLAKILVWQAEGGSGDRSEINLRGADEQILWQRLSAEDQGCRLERCEVATGGACPFYQASKAAQSADIVIVNHALLISDALVSHHALPEHRYVIVDEGHHLEDAITSGLSVRIDEASLRRRLADLGRADRGVLGLLIEQIRAKATEKEVKRIEAFIENLGEAIAAMDIHVQRLFKALHSLLDDLNLPTSDYSAQVRITEAVRARAAFSAIEEKWTPLKAFLRTLSDAMEQLVVALSRLERYEIEDFDLISGEVDAAARYLREVETELTALIEAPNPNAVYWISAGQERTGLAVHSAPLHIGSTVEQTLWHAKESVILTGATLRTSDGFDYLCERLSARDISAHALGSPYNYRDSTLLFLPTDIPDPAEKHRYQQAVERGLIALAAALNGRTLALFTSYAQLRQTAQAIAPRLALGNIVVYDQSDGSSRQALLEGFKAAERAVLLGTRSFWEGIDIPGAGLSAVVIVRLPFAVPSDPIIAARAEGYEDAFNEFTVPDAILRFRQGFGRLIRSSTDRGIVTIFDNRVLSKKYGQAFIEALPECTVISGPLDQLPAAALDWLGAAP